MDGFLTRRPTATGPLSSKGLWRLLVAVVEIAVVGIWPALTGSAAEPTYRQIFAAYSEGRSGEALELIEQLQITPPATDDQLKATYLAIEIVAQDGDQRETIAWCEHWLQLCGEGTDAHPLRPYVRFRRAMAWNAAGETAQSQIEFSQLYEQLPPSQLKAAVALELAWTLFAHTDDQSSQTAAVDQQPDVQTLASEAKALATPDSVNALSATLLLAALQLPADPNAAAALFDEILDGVDDDPATAAIRGKAALLMLEAANAGRLSADRQRLCDILENDGVLPPELQIRADLARGQAAAALGLYAAASDILLPLTADFAADRGSPSVAAAKSPTPSIVAAVTLLRFPPDANGQLPPTTRLSLAKTVADHLTGETDSDQFNTASELLHEVQIRGGFAAMELGDLPAAIEMLTSAFDDRTIDERGTDDLDRDALRCLGELLAASGQFEVAARYLDRYLQAAQAIGDEYQTAVAYFRLAENNASLNRWQAARESLARFSALGEPAQSAVSPVAICCLNGRIAIAAANFPDAVLHLSSAIEQVLRAENRTTNADKQIACRAAWLLGETYLLQRQFDLAIDAYSRVTMIDPASPWCIVAAIQTGKSLESLGRVQAAADIYSDLIANQPDSPYAASARARLDQLSRQAAKPPTGGGSDGLSR